MPICCRSMRRRAGLQKSATRHLRLVTSGFAKFMDVDFVRVWGFRTSGLGVRGFCFCDFRV